MIAGRLSKNSCKILFFVLSEVAGFFVTAYPHLGKCRFISLMSIKSHDCIEWTCCQNYQLFGPSLGPKGQRTEGTKGEEACFKAGKQFRPGG